MSGLDIDPGGVVLHPDSAMIGPNADRPEICGSNAKVNALMMLLGVVAGRHDPHRLTVEIARNQLDDVIHRIERRRGVIATEVPMTSTANRLDDGVLKARNRFNDDRTTEGIDVDVHRALGRDHDFRVIDGHLAVHHGVVHPLEPGGRGCDAALKHRDRDDGGDDPQSGPSVGPGGDRVIRWN